MRAVALRALAAFVVGICALLLPMLSIAAVLALLGVGLLSVLAAVLLQFAPR